MHRLVAPMVVAVIGPLVPAVALGLCFGTRAHVDPTNPVHLAALFGTIAFGLLCGVLVVALSRRS